MKIKDDKLVYDLHCKVNSVIEMQSLILLMMNDLTNGRYAEEVKDSIEKAKKIYCNLI